MDPALLELIASGAPGDEVAIIVRLKEGHHSPPGLKLVSRFGNIATGRARRGSIAAIHSHPSVASLKAPRTYSAEIPFRTEDSGDQPGISEADPTPQPSDERRPPGLPETGAGTVVAVIDWGLDFAHPDFKTPLGETRLLALWDQRAKLESDHYGYGKIHSQDEINRALQDENPFAVLGYVPSTTRTPAHGTHVMGIAAGNGQAGGPVGVAPEADLIFVHLGPGLGDLGNSIDLLEAIDFTVKVAGNRPLAINMSIGRHAGPHDGTLLIERAIDWLIVNRAGTVVVQSTGNYFSRDVHMQGRLRETRTASLPFILPRSDRTATTLELWYAGPDAFSVKAIAPDGSSTSAARGSNRKILNGDGKQLATLYHRAFDPNNGDHLISLVLKPYAPAGRWQIEITGQDVVDGRWHAWIERNAARPRNQAKFLRRLADRGSTTGSICNALRTIAVGAYNAHDRDYGLARFSSVGPTRDGRPKPLLVAPGVRVLSVRSRKDPSDLPAYIRMSGTSMAAPHVTGTAALMMQAAGRQPIAAIRRALFSGLDTSPATGPRWGYGLLNVGRAVAAARRLGSGNEPRPLRFETAQPSRNEAYFQEDGIMAEYEEENEDQEYEHEYAEGDFGETDPPNASEPSRDKLWTKGRDQTLPSPEQRVLSGFSNEQLRAMLTDDNPPVAVASLENTVPESPEHVLEQALNPYDRHSSVIGWPGSRSAIEVEAGDLLIEQSIGGRASAFMISDPRPLDQMQAAQIGAEAVTPGQYVSVLGAREAVQLTGPDGLLREDLTIVRSHGLEDAGERGFPEAAKPIIRNGSSGPAVREAQTRLNLVDAARKAAGQSGIDRCPLTVDGAFGSNTRAAVVSFQRISFPGSQRDWDGVVGQRTWAALIAASEDEEEQNLPSRCPGLPRSQTIDRFAFNSSDILPRHQPQIVGIARCIVESSRTSTPITRLTLIGHTDPVGSDSQNLALGTRRAESVRNEIQTTIRRMTGRASTVTFIIESRGERQPAGSDETSRRVEVVSDFEFNPAVVPPPPPPAATIDFVLDDDGDHRVDGSAPVATALMFGLWDSAHDAAGDIRNGAAEADNFVGSDVRRFYIRVNDRSATGSTVTARWRTLRSSRRSDDAPRNQNITLTETAPGSKIFVSRAVMLVTDNTDARQRTHSGFTSGPAAGLRRRGQSNHRLRRARLDGFVRADYRPASGGRRIRVTKPIFERSPESRRRLNIRVINYGGHASRAQMRAQFLHARQRWAQTGLHVTSQRPVRRNIPAAALDANGRYPGSIDNDEEVAALADLIPVTPDDTVTVVFVRKPVNTPTASNAYATVGQRSRSALGDRFFVFINPDVDPQNETLAHELHHVLYNRFDTPVQNRFFTFNTSPPDAFGIPLPDTRVYRRIQTLHSPDPNNDPRNDNIINWIRRRRTSRFPIGAGHSAATATTGNNLTRRF